LAEKRCEVKAANLGVEVHVVEPEAAPAAGVGRVFFKRIYSRSGIYTGAEGAMQAVRDQWVDKHGRIPMGVRLELKQTDAGTGEDQPVQVGSVAAPMYVLLDAMALGAELDPAFAIAGTVGSEGEYRTSVRMLEVLSVAAEAGATAMVVPQDMKRLLQDAAINGDLSVLFGMQVFGIESIDEAGRYMMQEREEAVNEAMQLFYEIRALLGGNWTMESLARNPAVQERLEQVVSLCPDHLSAETLLAYGRGELSSKSSLAGSLLAIEKITGPPLALLEKGTGGVEVDSNESIARKAIFDLRNLRPSLNEGAMEYADAVGGVLEIAEVLLDTKNRDTAMARQKIAEMAEAGGKLVGARQRLIVALSLGNDG
jgi:hypothetical protein